jgi:hypothetical protein
MEGPTLPRDLVRESEVRYGASRLPDEMTRLKSVASEAAQAGGPVVFTDDRLKGFLLKVSTGSPPPFYVQREVGGKTVRVASPRRGSQAGRQADDGHRLPGRWRRKSGRDLGEANEAAASDPAQAAGIVAKVRERLERGRALPSAIPSPV